MSVSQAEFAWPGGDIPGVLEFNYVPSDAVVKAIRVALAADFPSMAEDQSLVIRSLSEGPGPAGRYRASTQSSEWFLRVSSRWVYPELEQSLVARVNGQGVIANPLTVAGASLPWGGEVFRVDVRPFLQGGHFDGSDGDLRSLASTLAQSHQRLRDFPEAGSIRKNAASRFTRLNGICESLADEIARGRFDLFAEHESWAEDNAQWLSIMVTESDILLHEYPEAQCIHGEVHPGNVIFCGSDRRAVLVDFEESTHLFCPPAWDWAYLVQRFCLGGNPDRNVALHRVSQVAEGYDGPLPEMAPMMRQAAWLSMAVILDLRITSGVVSPVSELDKFVTLEQQANSYVGIL